MGGCLKRVAGIRMIETLLLISFFGHGRLGTGSVEEAGGRVGGDRGMITGLGIPCLFHCGRMRRCWELRRVGSRMQDGCGGITTDGREEYGTLGEWNLDLRKKLTHLREDGLDAGSIEMRCTGY